MQQRVHDMVTFQSALPLAKGSWQVVWACNDNHTNYLTAYIYNKSMDYMKLSNN